MVGRPYDEERDLAAVTRMWREVGWIDDTDEQAEGMRRFMQRGTALVADIAGEAECMVHRTSGSVRYRSTDLPLCAISGVTTSHVGRRQGLASALVVEALGAAAAAGDAVASLGFFEQGFYDRFGFGTGTYEHRITFDPATLTVPVPARPPVRLGIDDMPELHALMTRRHRGHGSVVLEPVDWFHMEWVWAEHTPFSLGFRGPDGRLTHALFGWIQDEHGPAEIALLAYEEPSQLLELLGLVRALGDQVNSVTVVDEPPGVQLQDLIRDPVRQRRIARFGGGSGALHQALAEQQDRILDLRACIGAVHLRTPPVSFGLRLHDPLATMGGWAGIGGDHTVHLGERSALADGLDGDLPLLEASVGAFTRLWLGVRPATGLALTDDLHGPPALLDALDEAFRLPTPRAGWSF